jgi:hypothetical protein
MFNRSAAGVPLVSPGVIEMATLQVASLYGVANRLKNTIIFALIETKMISTL